MLVFRAARLLSTAHRGLMRVRPSFTSSSDLKQLPLFPRLEPCTVGVYSQAEYLSVLTPPVPAQRTTPADLNQLALSWCLCLLYNVVTLEFWGLNPHFRFTSSLDLLYPLPMRPPLSPFALHPALPITR